MNKSRQTRFHKTKLKFSIFSKKKRKEKDDHLQIAEGEIQQRQETVNSFSLLKEEIPYFKFISDLEPHLLNPPPSQTTIQEKKRRI